MFSIVKRGEFYTVMITQEGVTTPIKTSDRLSDCVERIEQLEKGYTNGNQ